MNKEEEKYKREQIEELFARARVRVQTEQNGALSYFDSWLLDVRCHISQIPRDVSLSAILESRDDPIHRQMFPWAFEFGGLLDRIGMGRFVAYPERARRYPFVSSGGEVTQQGCLRTLEWRGSPLLKTVFDFALYPMLIHDLRPSVILELGSGSGASAGWLAELSERFGTQIFSVDINPPPVEHSRVSFLEGDCNNPESIVELLPFRTQRDGVLMLIEDAHVNVLGLLEAFHSILKPEDYLIIEDSGAKREAMKEFQGRHPRCYFVDTAYTDFFGVNQTSAWNSIWKKAEAHAPE